MRILGIVVLLLALLPIFSATRKEQPQKSKIEQSLPVVKVKPEKKGSFLSSVLSHIHLRAAYLYNPGNPRADQSDFYQRQTGNAYTQLSQSDPLYFKPFQGWSAEAGVSLFIFYLGVEKLSLSLPAREDHFTARTEDLKPEFPFPTTDLLWQTTYAKAGLHIHLGSGVYLLAFAGFPISEKLKTLSYNSDFKELYLSHEEKNPGWDSEGFPFWYKMEITPYENTYLQASESPTYGAEVMIKTAGPLKLGFAVRYTPRLHWRLLDWGYKYSPLVVGAMVGM